MRYETQIITIGFLSVSRGPSVGWVREFKVGREVKLTGTHGIYREMISWRRPPFRTRTARPESTLHQAQ